MPGVYFSNPTDIPSANLVDISDPNVLDSKILSSLASPSTCDEFKMTWPNFVKDSVSGKFYVEDRRVELYDNTDGESAGKTRILGGRCPQVPKTFLNEETCAVRSDCSPPSFSGDFELDAGNLRAFYDIDGKYVYRVENLPLVDTKSPCCTNNNRFVKKEEGACSDDSSSIFPTISSAIATHLSNLTPSEQWSKKVIDFEDFSMYCTDNAEAALGASFTVVTPSTGLLACWTHSYAMEWSVIVMNEWAVIHPGNPAFFLNSKPNPIADVAEKESTGNPEDSVTLRYPSWSFHERNFHDNSWRFGGKVVGSWGDRVAFNDLPDAAKSTNVVLALGGTVIEESGSIVEVCGSPGGGGK